MVFSMTLALVLVLVFLVLDRLHWSSLVSTNLKLFLRQELEDLLDEDEVCTFDLFSSNHLHRHHHNHHHHYYHHHHHHHHHLHGQGVCLNLCVPPARLSRIHHPSNRTGTRNFVYQVDCRQQIISWLLYQFI